MLHRPSRPSRRRVAAVAAGEASAIVTNPIAKHVLHQVRISPTPAIPSFSARWRSGTSRAGRAHPVMMLASDELRVVPLTVHMPARRRAEGDHARAHLRDGAHTSLAALRAISALQRPRIAVAGLNPHAGEGGTIGREEIDVIAPGDRRRCAPRGVAVTGPHPADTLFHAAARRDYDAVIAMYHDQALIPSRRSPSTRGVNVTLGLPFVRTSPDHGTAFDIAGTGRASPQASSQPCSWRRRSPRRARPARHDRAARTALARSPDGLPPLREVIRAFGLSRQEEPRPELHPRPQPDAADCPRSPARSKAARWSRSARARAASRARC